MSLCSSRQLIEKSSKNLLKFPQLDTPNPELISNTTIFFLVQKTAKTFHDSPKINFYNCFHSAHIQAPCRHTATHKNWSSSLYSYSESNGICSLTICTGRESKKKERLKMEVHFFYCCRCCFCVLLESS